MFGLVAVLVIAVGAATWELTTELGGEYFAMYVLESTDFGASKRNPKSLNAGLPPENQRQVVEGNGAPVLPAALGTARNMEAEPVTVTGNAPNLARISQVNRSFSASTARLWYTYQYVGLVGGLVRCGTQRVKPICRLCASTSIAA